MVIELFTPVPDMAVILQSRGGVYKQCQVYSLGGFLFAKTGGGFVRLRRDDTSNGLLIHHVIAEWSEGSDTDYSYDKLGRMIITNSRGATRAPETTAQQR